MSRNKLYLLFLIACLLGFIYLLYHLQDSENTHFGVCIIKNITGIPCPSCRTTRAVELLLQGNVLASLQMNPFGILVTLMMAIVPFWISFDLIFKKDTFHKSYIKIEKTIQIKWLAIILILLVILNWIWNIYKQI
jgi:Protein of unknown function (DUF2752)